MNDHRIDDLIRRAYTDHEHLAEPGRELDVMARAQADASAPTPLRRRRRPAASLLVGLAAACALLLLVVGGLVLGGPDRGQVATREQAVDVTHLTQRLRGAVEKAGTMTVTVTTEAGDRRGTDTRRLDLRTPGTPRLDARLHDEADPVAVLVGDQAWRRPWSSPDEPYSSWERGDGDVMWLALLGTPVDPHEAWSLGTEHVDGVPAEHLIVLPGLDPEPTTPPGAEPWSGRLHVDLWVATDSGRVLRADVVRDTGSGVSRAPLQVTYGEDMSITPPPARG